MISQKRPTSLSSEETYFDDPPDEEVDSEWEKITQDPAKRVAFERWCTEHKLTNEKRVIILQDNPSTRSHCRFNVKDLSGRYYGKFQQSAKPYSKSHKT